jgi:hypothetical protein
MVIIDGVPWTIEAAEHYVNFGMFPRTRYWFVRSYVNVLGHLTTDRLYLSCPQDRQLRYHRHTITLVCPD